MAIKSRTLTVSTVLSLLLLAGGATAEPAPGRSPNPFAVPPDVAERSEAEAPGLEVDRTPVAPPAPVTVESGLEPAKRRKKWGALLDAGVPEGATVAAVYRPFHWLQGHLGLSYNLLGVGIRGGANWVPLDYWISPSLVLEGGYFFSGSPRSFAENILGENGEEIPEDMSYAYGNGHVGVEMGTRNFSFYIRGGYTILGGRVAPAETSAGENVRFNSDASVFAAFPSAKLGFTVFFL